MKKRILSMLLVIVMVLSMVPVSALADGITITGKNYMEEGESVELTLSPGTAIEKVESKDPSIADVNWAVTTNPDKCTVTGIAEGKTDIIVTAGTEKKTYPVAVYKAVTAKPVIDATNTTVNLVGGTTVLTCTYNKGDCKQDVFRWKSSKPDVATINYKGELVPKAEGDTDITVFYNGQWSEAVTFTVKAAGEAPTPDPDPAPVEFTIKAEKTTVYTGKTIQLKAVDTNGNEVEGVNWGSSNPGLATVNWTTGVLTGVSAGEVDAIAKKGDVTVRQKFTVETNRLHITDEAGNPVEKAVIGETVQLQVRDSDNDVVSVTEWTSSDITAATVTDGALQGLHKSTNSVTITAKVDGFADATQKITVSSKSLVIKDENDNVLSNGDVVTLYYGESMKLRAEDGSGNPANVKWTSKNKTKVTVSAGTLKGIVLTDEGETVEVSIGNTGYETVALKVRVVAGTFEKLILDGLDASDSLVANESRRLIALDADNNEVTEGIHWSIVGNPEGVELKGDVLTVRTSEIASVTVRAEHPIFDSMEKTFKVDVVEPTGIVVNGYPEDGTVVVNNVLKLDIQPVPANTSFPSRIEWTSQNPNIAVVEDGKLIPKTAGFTVLTAKYGVRELCRLELVVRPATQIVLDDSLLPVAPGTVYTMLAGDELVLKAYLVNTATGKKINADVTWELAKESYGDFGRLDKNTLDTDSELLGRRTIELIASVDGAKYDAVPLKYTVNVVPRATAITLWVDGRKVNDKETVLDLNNDYEVADGVTIEAGITPAEAGQGVVWNITDDLGIYQSTQTEATDTDYASLTLKPTDAKRSGTITVKAVAKDGTKVFATTTVHFAKLGSGNLSGAPTALRGGASLNLRTYLEQDKDLDVKGVTWGFENNSNVVNGKKIASISKTGKLTTKAVKEPTEITVTIKGSAGGYVPHTITLYPTAKSVKITCDKLKALNNKVELSKDKEKRQFQLAYAVNPKILEDVWSVTWSSTDESIAKVNKNGQLTIKAPGKVRIDCTINDGSKVKGCLYLNVTSTVNTVTVTPNGRALTAGDSLDMKAVVKTPTGVKASNQNVIWSIADEYGEATTAASITGTGRVVAKNVDQATVVVVTATSVANSEVYGTAELTIKPNTKKTLHAYIDGEMVSGTISMNLNDSCIVDGMWLKNNGGLQDTKDCQFFSSNTNVATVDEELGTLTAVGYGTTTITLRCTDPQTNSQHNTTFTVKVMKKVGTVTISAPDLKDLRSGKSVSLGATAWADYANGVKADDQSFTWEVHEVVNDEVQDKETDAASINSNGVLYAGKVAYKRVVEVRAISKENGVSAAVRFNIFPADSVALAFMLDSEEYANILPIDIDDYSNALPLKVMVHEAIADSKGNITENPTREASVTWSSDNKDVVEVKDNVLHVKAIGKAKLTAKYYREADKKTYQASITIVVNQTVGSVEEILLSNILVAGKSAYLRAAFENVNATNKNVLWFVTGENADKVQLNTYTGRIKAKSNIDERITVHVVASPVDGSDGEEADIMIYPRTTKVEILNVVNGATVRASMSDESLVFEATAAPTGAYADSFKWTSSNTKIAEVDDEGNVTLKKAGAVTIKATALDGSGKYARFKLRITND